ncbi:MAG: hypothetical protein H6686_00400 [Fibrobacteria bacterium]|nr:hypothetical protein [Fibrobacteria bacterium]
MSTHTELDESTLTEQEARIPELAQAAVRKAYRQALESSGSVVEAVGGNLVVTTRTGRTVLHALTKPIPVKVGERRVRKA